MRRAEPSSRALLSFFPWYLIHLHQIVYGVGLVMAVCTLVFVPWTSDQYIDSCGGTQLGGGQRLAFWLASAVGVLVAMMGCCALAFHIENPHPHTAVFLLNAVNFGNIGMGVAGAEMARELEQCRVGPIMGVSCFLVFLFFLSIFFVTFHTVRLHAPLIDPLGEGSWPLVYIRCLCLSKETRKGLLLSPLLVLILCCIISILDTRDESCSEQPLRLCLYLALGVFTVFLGMAVWLLFFVQAYQSRAVIGVLLGCSLLGLMSAILITLWLQGVHKCEESSQHLYHSAVSMQIILYLGSGTLFFLSTCCKLESCFQVVDKENFFPVDPISTRDKWIMQQQAYLNSV